MRGVVAWAMVAIAMTVGGPAAAQQPAATEPPGVVRIQAPAPPPANPWFVAPKLPEVKAPEVKAPDYFGPSPTAPFNEKSLFPTPPKLDAPPPTPAPDGLPPPPGVGPAIVVPDGSLPAAPPPRRWRGGFEFGVNGSDGNSDVLSLRLGTNFDTKHDRNVFHLDVLYTLTRQDGTTRQNQAILNARDEVLFPDSPWSVFTATQVEYDEFRAYDLRAGAYAGLSRRWLKNDTTSLKTRLGAGATREMDTRGTASDRWVPEAVIGGDFNHRFTDRQSFVSSVDVFPNLSQIGQFRVRARAGYEIVVDPEHGMVLRLGVQDRYDSSPANARRNDLNYFATLLFRF